MGIPSIGLSQHRGDDAFAAQDSRAPDRQTNAARRTIDQRAVHFPLCNHRQRNRHANHRTIAAGWSTSRATRRGGTSQARRVGHGDSTAPQPDGRTADRPRINCRESDAESHHRTANPTAPHGAPQVRSTTASRIQSARHRSAARPDSRGDAFPRAHRRATTGEDERGTIKAGARGRSSAGSCFLTADDQEPTTLNTYRRSRRLRRRPSCRPSSAPRRSSRRRSGAGSRRWPRSAGRCGRPWSGR